MAIEQGDLLPDLKMTDSDGAPLDLGVFRGRPLVLYFYPKDDTSGCTLEAQGFSAAFPDFQAAGVAVLGVSRDSAKKHRKFIEKYQLAVPLASDEEGAVTDAFGVWVEKSMYGRKYMGVERSTFLLDAEGRVQRIWRKVKVPGHVEEVLAAARALPSA